MKRVAWITDSTTASFTTEGDNFVIPIEVIIDGVSYKIVKKVCVSAFIIL